MWKKILIIGALVLSLFAVTAAFRGSSFSAVELCRCGCELSVEKCTIKYGTYCGYNDINPE